MSGEKRPAANSFGSAQLVKRAKSDANVKGSSAVAVVNGSAQNGALIQAVCYQSVHRLLYANILWSGPPDKLSAVTSHGIDR
jgi:hypothetical protein